MTRFWDAIAYVVVGAIEAWDRLTPRKGGHRG